MPTTPVASKLCQNAKEDIVGPTLNNVSDLDDFSLQDDQLYDTVQDFMTPQYVGEQTDKNLHTAKDLNDPLSLDEWTPSFVYDATESESIAGQSGYDQSDIGGEPGEASVAAVRKSRVSFLDPSYLISRPLSRPLN